MVLKLHLWNDVLQQVSRSELTVQATAVSFTLLHVDAAGFS